MGKARAQTFQEFATQGSSIATAVLDRETFDAILNTLSDRFGLSVKQADEAFNLLQDRLHLVAGRFWHETQTINRKDVVSRLEKLSVSARDAALALQAVRSGPGDLHDLAVITLLSEVLRSHLPELSLQESREQVEGLLQTVETLYYYSEEARGLVSHMGSRKGQRGLAWYDAFVDLMIEAAALLGIRVTTAGDRVEDPYATPFTVLVYAVERSLPQRARSKTLAACAKRTDRSLAKKRHTTE